MRFDTETHHAVRDAFMITAASLIEGVVENRGKPVEGWGWQMDALIEALTCGLIGVAYYDED